MTLMEITRIANPTWWTRFKMWRRTLLPIPRKKKPVWVKDDNPIINIDGYMLSFVPIMTGDNFTVCISIRLSIGSPFSRAHEIHRVYFDNQWVVDHVCYLETKDIIYAVHARDLIGFII